MPRRPDASVVFFLAAFAIMGFAGLTIFVLSFTPMRSYRGSWLGLSVPVIVLVMFVAVVIAAIGMWRGRRRRR